MRDFLFGQRLVFSLLVLALNALGARAADVSTGSVVAIRVEGIIGPTVAGYIDGGLKRAIERDAAALLIELDTPGGLLDSTRDIVGSIINSPVPVLIYVGPRGARATSAGVFLMMAADVAAMAPETHLGAAHPVSLGGEEKPGPRQPEPEKANGDKKEKRQAPAAANESVMSEKAVSDASAYIRALAESRGRNAEWAEQAVRQSVSLTAKEALDKNVIDLMATSRDELLAGASGRKILKGGKTITLNLTGREIVEMPMTAIQKFFHLLGHPNVAYILMMLGIYGLIHEFASPGLGFGAAAGVTCLLLAFYSLRVLPVNAVALALILLGVGLLVADLFTVASGLLTLGGLVALGLGSVLLIDRHPIPFPRVSFYLVAPTVATTGLFFAFVVRKVLQTRRLRVATGEEGLIGSEAEVTKALNPTGMVFMNGELWQARSDVAAEPGEKVIVVGREGPVLIVRRSREQNSEGESYE